MDGQISDEAKHHLAAAYLYQPAVAKLVPHRILVESLQARKALLAEPQHPKVQSGRICRPFRTYPRLVKSGKSGEVIGHQGVESAKYYSVFDLEAFLIHVQMSSEVISALMELGLSPVEGLLLNEGLVRLDVALPSNKIAFIFEDEVSFCSNAPEQRLGSTVMDWSLLYHLQWQVWLLFNHHQHAFGGHDPSYLCGKPVISLRIL